jgi:cellulose biosynthesis protein BcsQ
MPKTLAVSNEKGGVAKTTTALSLGAALAELGNRVLLIDLDAQANLTLAIGFEPGEAELTSSHVMLDNTPLLTHALKPQSNFYPFAPTTPPSYNVLSKTHPTYLTTTSY